MPGVADRLLLNRILGCHLLRIRFIETMAVTRAHARLAWQNIAYSVEHVGHDSWALCAYGSISRGDFSPRSDCDLMILLRVNENHATEELLRSLGRLPRVSVATISIDQHELQESPPTLHRLSTLYHLKFICGDTSLFQLAKQEYRTIITSLSIMELVSLWHGDVYRTAQNHCNASAADLKKSAGGTIDYDFGRILQDWIVIARKTMPPRVTSCLRSSNLFIKLLCVAKMNLPNSTQPGPSSLPACHYFVSLMARSHRRLLDSVSRDIIRWSQPQRSKSMDILLKLFSRAYIHATLIILGALLIVVSIVAKIPGTTGGEIVLRHPTDIVSLITGSIFTLLGLALAVYTTKSSHGMQWEAKDQSASPQQRQDFDDLIHMPAPTDFRQQMVHTKSIDKPSPSSQALIGTENAANAISTNSADFPQRIRDRFMALSPTQKRVVSHLYRIVHSSEISVDDLMKGFDDKYDTNRMSGPAEMYYRLAALGFLGFIIMRGIGERSTMVVKIEAVGAVLLNGDLLDS
jgi:hypothetical protein